MLFIYYLVYLYTPGNVILDLSGTESKIWYLIKVGIRYLIPPREILKVAKMIWFLFIAFIVFIYYYMHYIMIIYTYYIVFFTIFTCL